LFVNIAFLDVVGAAREAIVGRRFDEAFPGNAADPKSFGNVRELRASLDRVRETGRPNTVPLQRYTVPGRDRKGEFEERFWSVADAPLYDGDGALRYIVHRIEDVTDIVHSTRSGIGEENARA